MLKAGMMYSKMVWLSSSIWPYLRWSGWALFIFATACFIASAVAHQLEKKKRWAIWINEHSPQIVKLAGMSLSRLSVRFLVLVSIGFVFYFCLSHNKLQSDNCIQQQIDMPGPRPSGGSGAPR